MEQKIYLRTKDIFSFWSISLLFKIKRKIEDGMNSKYEKLIWTYFDKNFELPRKIDGAKFFFLYQC